MARIKTKTQQKYDIQDEVIAHVIKMYDGRWVTKDELEIIVSEFERLEKFYGYEERSHTLNLKVGADPKETKQPQLKEVK